MKIETFALERWMTRWEMDVQYDIAESGIYPMTTREPTNHAGWGRSGANARATIRPAANAAAQNAACAAQKENSRRAEFKADEPR